MDTGGWDTISVLDVAQVNTQLATRLNELVMTFEVSWDDAFSGSYSASGQFSPWSITGGSGSDIDLTLPIASGSITPQGTSGQPRDISGMSVTLEVNLEWVPTSVSPQGKSLVFAMSSVADQGSPRQAGQVSVVSTTDPDNTGFAAQVGRGIATAIVEHSAEVTFIFAQTGVVDTSTATWLQPVQSTYSLQQPEGSATQYLAVLSVTDSRDISGLSGNIDAGIVSPEHPLSFVVSGPLFLANVILPALARTFPHAAPGTFSCSAGQITSIQDFNLPDVKAGAIWYTPTVTSMTLTIDGGSLKNVASGSVYLDLPHAYLDFSATTQNALSYDTTNQSFTFLKDPNPVTSTSKRIPWYDYLITILPIADAITAVVVTCVASGLSDSLTGSDLAGSLDAAPATSVQWQGLNQVTIASGTLDDCFLLLANVS